jgi:hypothetical protein
MNDSMITSATFFAIMLDCVCSARVLCSFFRIASAIITWSDAKIPNLNNSDPDNMMDAAQAMADHPDFALQSLLGPSSRGPRD